ncbi:MAG: glycine/betaine ABC transporter substrate-binding protein, partial [Rhodobacteraceae bacterium]|nr:glycine/betaine ABC transporter substrate-binding protein [Paracoccaceae bacterium]
MSLSRLTTATAALALMTAPALADCNTVRFSDVGWTDITATTAATTTILNALGYQTEVLVLSVPVTYTSMANGDIDVFLGNW